MHILVQFSDAGLFNSSDSDELATVDMGASAERYAGLVCRALDLAYPGATFRVEHCINDCVTVDGDTDHPEADWVDDIVGRIYHGWSWVVKL